MAQSSRRKFMKAASVTAAALAVSHRLPAWAGDAASSASVRVWVTDYERRHAQAAPRAWKPAADAAPDAIVLDPGVPRQQILGFGAALTDAACFVLSQIPQPQREELMRELFAPDQMALSVCRTTIGASDYSRSLYSYDESAEPDPELKKFSIDHDKAYILPTLLEARKANPELFLFSSPWSPPGWMKANGSMLGGAMPKRSFAPYAQYFLKFLQGYKENGVAINAVTVQNEVDTNQDGNMPACQWGQEYETEFVEQHLGPALLKTGSQTKIWVIDHNYNLWGRAIGELSLPGASQYIDGIAWHGYLGTPEAMTRVHEAFPHKNAYWTEGGPDITAADYQTDFTRWAETFNGILRNWARSITAWNLALDEKGKPNIGPFTCGGVVTVDNASKKVTHSGQYWALAHFSRHIHRGARVFQTNEIGQDAGQSGVGELSHCGFSNPDGSFVVVLTNRGQARRAQLLLDEQMLELDLPAGSVLSLQWA